MSLFFILMQTLNYFILEIKMYFRICSSNHKTKKGKLIPVLSSEHENPLVVAEDKLNNPKMIINYNATKAVLIILTK